MKQVRFHPAADEELVEAEAWYRVRSEVAAQAFHSRSLTLLPSLWRHRYAGLWAAAVNGVSCWTGFPTPFFIAFALYRLREDHVYITAVAHQSRRPGYWRHRN
jgi:plasmid stabilization system protein ParE